MNTERIVIVDPYSSGKLLAPAFRERGFQCIALHTADPASTALGASLIAQDFEQHHLFDGSLQRCIASITAQGPVRCVLPGTESGVTLANELAAAMGLAHNPPELAAARRHKYLMQETIARAGLRAIRQARVGSVAEALDWAAAQGRWPVVVKPAASAGSDGVRLCADADELAAGVTAILEKRNFLGLANDEAILQEYVTGTEYVVDTVSCAGRHYTTNLCRYRKEVINGAFVYRRTYFLPATGPAAEALIAYNDAVLDALGITQGAAHSEIMLTEDGPVLIEVGARLHGGVSGPLIVERCARHAPQALLADSYVAPERFAQAAREVNAFSAKAVAYCFVNAKTGRVRGFPMDEAMKSLPSFFELKRTFGVGHHAVPTADLYSSPGWVVLVHEDEQQFLRDIAQVEHWEAEGALIDVADATD